MHRELTLVPQAILWSQGNSARLAANSLTERNDERNIQTREETRSSEKYIKPAVNIIETEEGLMLTADIPVPRKTRWKSMLKKGY